MLKIPTKLLSLEEFLHIPETKPANEYINGEIIQKPMPQGKHSILQRELSFALTLALKTEKIAQAFPELRCTFGGRSIVPDVSVFRTERIPRDRDGQVANLFHLHPDWTIEILSPQQSQSKVIRNILYCLDHGTEMGWLLDPAESLIFVYGIDRSVRVFEDVNVVLPMPEFAGVFQLKLGEIFAWLKE
ncbi:MULTISPECIES: Uma2 family endonuclease [Spirulina sp. CCY15215]|uniref:Uma2 family endonuclease n=1 Tax=Spirulina sp. CCY15215 TaxID=2767591 RepID=UPI00194F9544|nr:Uma2 family endonuclease [Spirulina major]